MSTPRARKIQHYLTMLRAEAIDHAAFAADDAATRRCIEHGIDLETADYIAMLRSIAALAPPDFALRFGGARRLADMGVVGHAIMSCETLRQALGIWNGFSSFAGDPLSYRAGIDEGIWWNDLFPAAVMPATLLRFFSEEWAASFCRFAVETTGADCRDAVIEFRHRPLPQVDYGALLPVTPRFGCARNRISFPAGLLDAAILSRDDEMFELLVQHFARAGPERPGSGVAAQLRHLFFASAGRVPQLAEAARLLGISGRTLGRRLAAEGTSYAAVLADYRSDYAQALVREGTLGAKQIAHAIGYRSHQSLRRAFTGWVGEPIGSWRATIAPAKR